MFSPGHRHPRLVCTAAALLGGLLTVAVAGASNSVSRPVTLEVIVKFARDSDPGRMVRQTLVGDPTDLSGLAPAVEKLEAATGIAMEARRITSGSELIVGIPEGPLLEIVEKTVDRHPSVTGTRLMATRHGNPNLPGSLLMIEFGSTTEEAAQVARARAESGHEQSLQTLASRLCASSGVPVRGTSGADADLIVSVDRAALLTKLVAGLNDLDFVDYAQANLGVHIMK